MALDQLDWQTVVSLIIVFGAIGVLARKMWKTVFGAASNGCGSCGSCPTAKSEESNGALKVTKLVQLASPANPNKARVDDPA